MTDRNRYYETKRLVDIMTERGNALAGVPAFTREATPLQESMIDVQRVEAQMHNELVELFARVEKLQAEKDELKEWKWRQLGESAKQALLYDDMMLSHRRIASILDTFSRALMSISSLQPILDLAIELNPRKGQK